MVKFQLSGFGGFGVFASIKKVLNVKNKKKYRNCHNLYLGAETAFEGASKFKNDFLLLQLVFEL